MQVWSELQIQVAGDRRMFAVTSRAVQVFRLNYVIFYF